MKKVSLFMIIATAAYLLVSLGFYVGRLSDGTQFSVETEVPKSHTYSPQSLLVDINSDDAYSLMTLDGIGEILAQRIITYRLENGPFEDVDDLLQVEGISENALEKIRDYVTVGDLE